MNTSKLLTPLEEAGLMVRTEGCRLVVFPADRITNKLRNYIIEHKSELMALLAANDPHHATRSIAFPVRLIGRDGTGYMIDHDGPVSAVADLLARYGDRLDVPALVDALRGMDDAAKAEADRLIAQIKMKGKA